MLPNGAFDPKPVIMPHNQELLGALNLMPLIMNHDACKQQTRCLTDEVPAALYRGAEQDAIHYCQDVLWHGSSFIGAEMSYKVSCSVFNSDTFNWHLRTYCWCKEGLSRLVLQTIANN